METKKRMVLIDNVETKVLKKLEEVIGKDDVRAIYDWLYILSNVQRIQ